MSEIELTAQIKLLTARTAALEQTLATQERRARERFDELQRTFEQQTRILESILDNLADGVVVTDEAGNMLRFNPAAEAIIGLAFSEATPVDPWATTSQIYGSFLPDGSTPYPLDELPLARAIKGEEVDEAEMFIVHSRAPDGIWVSVNARPLRDERGELRGGVAVFRDITARRRADAELHEVHAALENAVEGISRLDTQGRYIAVNGAFARLFGYEPEEMIGLEWQTTVHTHDLSTMVAAYQEMITTGKAKCEARGLRRDGTSFFGEVTVIMNTDQTDQFRGHHLFIKDITARKEAERALDEHVAELARSNAELQRFAYIASHDLQEPLRSVASFTQLLSRRYQGRLDKDADDFIALALDGVGRMKGLIDDLLTYSRVGSRGIELVLIESRDAFAWARANLDAAIVSSGAVVVAGELPAVYADATQLRQVFQNLIGNGLKFSRQGIAPSVRVGASQRNDEWLFAFEDNGIGISPEYQDKLFVLFRRLHGRDAYPGSGLGLAICKKIIERHGGRIWFESKPGAGSTFYFTLPVERMALPRTNSSAPPGPVR